ncbi:hypothetical protein B0J13DRAFT_474212 [Dactylonectria estremocensis]|uniref:NmrA-like domain-containing protein n=1 Tax=Dactylonectria estremocensis TaxID=1079267 RepID=A0A9P9EUI2_9HYPO|nr:hypothetical protein B0J13DRAFT_474212 [Dactylonectria estremocensis]
MSKLITVFGATGNQGGSVVRALLNDPALSREFKIRGITRDVSKPAAQALAAKGVEVVAADMATVELAAPAVAGAHTVFMVTNYWENPSGDGELVQGKAVTDACKAAGVKHLIFSSLINVSEVSGGRLTHIHHFDGKAKIEQYIRSSGVPASFVLPGFFMSNLFTMIRDNGDGEYKLSLPVSPEKAQLPLANIGGDLGKFVSAAIRTYPESINKNIYAATEYYTPSRIMSEFSEVIGQPASFTQVSEEAFKGTRSPEVAQEMLENMLLLEDPGYYGGVDLKESLDLLTEKPTTWKEFVQTYKEKWL